MDIAGNWTYTLDTVSLQSLIATEQVFDSFTVTSIDGTTAQVDISIDGLNDIAAIGGALTRSTNEDAVSETGTLTITDEDAGEAAFVAQTSTAGTYGTFDLDSLGNWTYTRTSNLDEMNAGDELTDSFTVVSADGTASELVTITITGVNDDASISGDNAGAMNEDAAGDSGAMTVSDLDDGEDVFQAQTGDVGTYGTFDIDAAGNWTYTRTSNLDDMNAGDELTDSFTVVSADGTASELVTITITGVNDDASISGDNVGAMSEDAAGDSGAMTVSDLDDGEDVFQAQTGCRRYLRHVRHRCRGQLDLHPHVRLGRDERRR